MFFQSHKLADREIMDLSDQIFPLLYAHLLRSSHPVSVEIIMDVVAYAVWRGRVQWLHSLAGYCATHSLQADDLFMLVAGLASLEGNTDEATHYAACASRAVPILKVVFCIFSGVKEIFPCNEDEYALRYFISVSHQDKHHEEILKQWMNQPLTAERALDLFAFISARGQIYLALRTLLKAAKHGSVDILHTVVLRQYFASGKYLLFLHRLSKTDSHPDHWYEAAFALERLGHGKRLDILDKVVRNPILPDDEQKQAFLKSVHFDPLQTFFPVSPVEDVSRGDSLIRLSGLFFLQEHPQQSSRLRALSRFLDELEMYPGHFEESFRALFWLLVDGLERPSLSEYLESASGRNLTIRMYLGLRTRGEKALDYLKALQHPRALYHLASVLREEGMNIWANQVYQKLIRKHPGVALFHAEYGDFLESRGRTEDAIVAYGNALRYDPELSEVRERWEVLSQQK
jgi:tetratricopeptide (TPR) repeat protein